MNIDLIPTGDNPPDTLNVVIEVPVGGEPVKYEFDKKSGALFVDRILHTPMRYPANYGFVPHTLSPDGDPLDALVIARSPFIPGCVVRVRPIAVLSEKRVATLPNVPTSKEAGFPSFQMSIWYGMMAPAGTPREIVARLHQEIVRAFADPTLRQQMANAGMDPWLGTPEDMSKLVQSEMARYAKIIQSAGIKKDAL